jgi:acetate CoA/acetoacetate CoA-transferase beta subunit
MDLVSGARRVIVAMTYAARGKPKLVRECGLTLTSVRPVDLIVTELGVLRPTHDGLTVVELAEGVSLEQIHASTSARTRLS